ncbi:DUF3592 domain-containing protein [Streptomyces colonosanans]|uniref:DUF3592 domain-containing protein n=1 Tax=Streptomyces colonosanans TaxID=1428652 RepID=A0A1S2NV14_9ACTN|nr:DUF3592 domain-containing protein [Streptomyces colonosanans]OIJ85408.1 hypothetical protein BIV24_28455 [Streptomyces colonosanans]
MSTFEIGALGAGLACATGVVLFLYRVVLVIWLVLRGERTQGWCAKRRLVSSTSVGHSSRTEFTFAFRTPEGETVEFKDRPGAFGYEEGAPVRVCYDPARPHKRATIAGPDTWGPVYTRILFCVPLGMISFVMLYGMALHLGFISSY